MMNANLSMAGAWVALAALSVPLAKGAGARTRLAVVGLDHDHVWGLLEDMAQEPNAELVAIADPSAELIQKARARVSSSVEAFADYVRMLDAAKPDGVIVTTENARHLEILKECAKRHIHYSTEKPMATTAAGARQMEQLARQAKIKLMVNYWNAWVAPTHELFHRVHGGGLGPVWKIIAEYGHQGPNEIGISRQFARWLYDPERNGGGALMDFGCYGAELALWLKGRPARVYATARKLKADQRLAVEDEATILLEYPDATAIVQASWDWPYSKGQVEVFGPKGSLVALYDQLLYRPAAAPDDKKTPLGEPVELKPVPHETSNPIAYFVDCIRNDKPIEAPVSARLNVEVMEILDAAKESIRTGRAVSLAPENE